MNIEEVTKWLSIIKANLNSFPEVSSDKKSEALGEAIRLLKNEQSIDKVDCDNADCNNCVNHKYCDYESNKSENPTGSTTKKCITCAYREIDGKPHEMCKSCVCGNRYKQEPQIVPIAVIKCEYDEDKLKELVDKAVLTVTPQEPKRGHWKLVQRGKIIDICCSNCEAVRVKEYAYNYTIDQLTKEDLQECFECADMRYCPNCGADMREVEE